MLEIIIYAFIAILPVCGHGDALESTPCGYVSEIDPMGSSFFGINGRIYTPESFPHHR